MTAELLIHRSQVAIQEALNNPVRSGLLVAGSSFVIVTALAAFSLSPLDYSAATLFAIGTLFFSLQHAIAPSKTFSYMQFPNWYKEKSIFDCALLSNIWLTYRGKSVTAALAVTDQIAKVSLRQTMTFDVLQSLQAQGQIGTIFNRQQERGLGVSDGTNTYSIGIDSEFVINRLAALKYVEENFLCQPPKITTAEQLEQFICKLHTLLAKGLVNSSGIPIPPGKYRTGIILLPKDNVGTDLDAIVQNVRRKEPKSAQLFLKLAQQIEKSSDPLATFRQFTSEKARIYSLGYDILYTDPKDIPAEMKQFCKIYMEKIHAQTDPLDLATWVHLELIKIHPFLDLNGHTSRILASTELRRGGFSPLFIFDETAYIKAQEKRDPATFRAFLKDTIKRSEKLEKILEEEKPLPKGLINIQG